MGHSGQKIPDELPAAKAPGPVPVSPVFAGGTDGLLARLAALGARGRRPSRHRCAPTAPRTVTCTAAEGVETAAKARDISHYRPLSMGTPAAMKTVPGRRVSQRVTARTIRFRPAVLMGSVLPAAWRLMLAARSPEAGDGLGEPAPAARRRQRRQPGTGPDAGDDAGLPDPHGVCGRPRLQAGVPPATRRNRASRPRVNDDSGPPRTAPIQRPHTGYDQAPKISGDRTRGGRRMTPIWHHTRADPARQPEPHRTAAQRAQQCPQPGRSGRVLA